jgi:hypothetical protein
MMPNCLDKEGQLVAHHIPSCETLVRVAFIEIEEPVQKGMVKTHSII